MVKTRTAYFCQNCGAQSPKWVGRCPACGEWNTYVEEVIQTEGKNQILTTPGKESRLVPKTLKDIEINPERRSTTKIQELDRVLGGGLVPGSIILLGGEPGIGKSTLMLQVAMARKDIKTLYISGEESIQQLRMRAERLNLESEHCYFLSETNTQAIINIIQTLQPGLLVIDSIQTLHSDLIESSAGSISQVRQCASELQRLAKLTHTPVFLVGHITKDGTLAGPKILEHMVDTVLQFEGDRHHGYRILRSMKNRFGSASELGIFEMTDKGLREVSNPSEILITQREEDTSGIAIAATIEGMRPMLIETQALVSTAAYGTPQRSSTGFDARRLNMLLAVLEKRSGFRLGSKDVFLNIAGGIYVDDPAIDLAVITAVLSSNSDIPVPANIAFAGEVGLSGEIRAVNRIEQRIAEAEKLGFGEIYISSYNARGISLKDNKIRIRTVKKVEDLFTRLFG
ncbi:MAG: DNA repair protein RadA [Bacteroidetes bacterium]|nr:DNA repair protein RadA [Bacteroidota bacterium]